MTKRVVAALASASAITAVAFVEALSDDAPVDGVLHFDVQVGADARLVYETLRPVCGPDLTFEMVEDLLDPDVLPQVEEQDTDGRVGTVSAFAVKAIEPRAESAASSGGPAFELVEFLANEHWVITCSHRVELATLRDLRGLASEYRARLSALNGGHYDRCARAAAAIGARISSSAGPPTWRSS